jgi:hypothetical protein
VQVTANQFSSAFAGLNHSFDGALWKLHFQPLPFCNDLKDHSFAKKS